MRFQQNLLALALVLLVGIPAWADDRAPTQSRPSRAAASLGALRVKAALSHGLYARSTPDRLVLKIDLSTSSAALSKRAPLNLALVIDRSGSMANEKKLDYAMDAARLIAQNLSDRDTISIIAFGDEALVLSPAGRAVNKRFLGHRLDEIEPGGSTNLSAGLLEAFAQIDSAAAKNQIKRVIVLTDGIANRGVTEPDRLRAIVAAARKRSIALSTIGVGNSFNAPLMTTLANAGGGRYTYVRSPEQISDSISAELNGLLAVVAQNVKLEVRALESARFSRVYGRPTDRPLVALPFRVGDLRAGERGSFLLEISPNKFAQGETTAVQIEVTIDRPDIGAREKKTLRVEATFTSDTGRVAKSEDESVRLHASILDAVERAEDAVLGLDAAEFRKASELFRKFHERARKFAIRTRDQELLNRAFLLKHSMAELAAASRSGAIHPHDEAQQQIKKGIEYQRYLRQHHRSRQE